MRKVIYKLINKLGYNIYSKSKKDIEIREKLKKYPVIKNYNLLFHSSQYIFLLQNKFQELHISDSHKGLRVSFQNLVFHVDSHEEFLILNEIFVNKDYNFRSPEQCVIIDIGANVGMASIFFSQLDHVEKIYAFEPVKETYDIALQNLKNNKITKITRFNNYGLGNSNRNEKFPFNHKGKGSFGMRANSKEAQNDAHETRVVIIKKASEEIGLILDENPNSRMVLKMDCEGAEYEILQGLHNSSLLSKIDIIILEWHDHGAALLEEYLIKNNFTVFSRDLDTVSGILSAVRNKGKF